MGVVLGFVTQHELHIGDVAAIHQAGDGDFFIQGQRYGGEGVALTKRKRGHLAANTRHDLGGVIPEMLSKHPPAAVREDQWSLPEVAYCGQSGNQQQPKTWVQKKNQESASCGQCHGITDE